MSKAHDHPETDFPAAGFCRRAGWGNGFCAALDGCNTLRKRIRQNPATRQRASERASLGILNYFWSSSQRFIPDTYTALFDLEQRRVSHFCAIELWEPERA